MNNPCLKLLGAASADQVLGKSLLDFIHPDYHAVVRASSNHGIGRAGAAHRSKDQGVDGTLADVEISPSSFLEDDILAIQVVCRDVSDRKKLEEQVQQATKMEAVGSLAGGIAHDFNNLLTVILGNCDFLAASLPQNDTKVGFVREIQKAGEHATHLTRQLLAFSRKAVVEPRYST